MKPVSNMSRLELAAFIAAEFRRRKINVVLSGGSCVSIYSAERYVSMDLDFVNAGFAKRGDISEVERWSAVEGKQEAFDGIKHRLKRMAQPDKSSARTGARR